MACALSSTAHRGRSPGGDDLQPSGAKAFGGAELLSQTLHNLYTLRGAKVRDALQWANYIDASRAQAAGAEVLFNQHHWPVWGQDNIQAFLTAQRDVYRYLHDQTVRLMNAGLTAPEIAEQLRLPASLDQHLHVHGYYGTLKHNVRAIYQFYRAGLTPTRPTSTRCRRWLPPPSTWPWPGQRAAAGCRRTRLC